MEIKGQHLIVDAFDCNADMINNADDLKRATLETIRELDLEILHAYFHSFFPQGITGTVTISSSHFSIHTWPENKYAALDLYTCSHQDAWPMLKKFLAKIGTGRFFIYEISRGIKGQIVTRCERHLGSYEKRAVTPGRNRGNEWDMKILKEIRNGNQHRILYEGSSEIQDILLVEAKDLRLYLNDELQFSSLDEKHYHESLVLPAMELAISRKRVLILGGGDGLALREVLKYRDTVHVDLVEIDPQITGIAKHEPALATANAGSLRDQRVKVHTMDAKEYVKKEMEKYDVIIIDFPDPVDSAASLLYTAEFFSEAGHLLKPHGILACQANSPRDTPKVYWSIAKTLNAAGFKTKAYFTVVPSFGAWGFHLASREMITKELPAITVPHQAINSNLERLFHVPPNLRPPETGLIVNRKNNLKLHELYDEEIKINVEFSG